MELQLTFPLTDKEKEKMIDKATEAYARIFRLH
jgi:lauroyl/myristoyl acyltransferase